MAKKKRTAKQKAASKKNIRKAQKKSGKKRRSAAQKAASKRNIKLAQKAGMGGFALGSKPKRRRSKPKAAKRRRSSKKRRRTSSKRRRSSASKSSSRSSSTKVIRTEKTRVVRVPKSGTQAIHIALSAKGGGKKRRRSGKRRGKKRSRNPSMSLARPTSTRLGNPGLLSGNPYSKMALVNFGTAAVGVAVGNFTAKMVDRWWATRTPEGGVRPLYGRDASAAILRRPGWSRMLVQGVLAFSAMGAAYFTRHMKVVPSFFAGVAVGAGAAIVEAGLTWIVAPALLKTKEPSETTLANRLLPMEQFQIQDNVDLIMANWKRIPEFKATQAEASVFDAAQKATSFAARPIKSVFGYPVNEKGEFVVTAGESDLVSSGNTYQLGNKPQQRLNAPPQRAFVRVSGRVGKCASCGGVGGCWQGCSQCDEQNGYPQNMAGVGQPTATYEVSPGDNLTEMAGLAGLPISAIRSLNGNREIGDIWRAGNRVQVPFALGQVIEARMKAAQSQVGTPPPAAAIETPPAPPVAAPVAEPVIAADNSNDAERYASVRNLFG